MKKYILITLISLIPENNTANYVIMKKNNSMITNRVLGEGNWGTHMTPLLTAIMHTEGPILELGGGDYSTPMLHAICSEKKRHLVSAESDRNWLENFLDLQCDWHTFIWVQDVQYWDQIGNDIQWGVVFIDHAPWYQRKIDLKRLKNSAKVIVIHDTENLNYGLEEVLRTFTYRYDYLRYQVRTTLVSDTINVASFFN